MSPVSSTFTLKSEEGNEEELQLGRFLGRGATASVYLSQLSSGKLVAVKCLKFKRNSVIKSMLIKNKDEANPPSLTKLRDIENEIDIMNKVKGSFSVKILGTVRMKTQIWMVLEFCPMTATQLFNQSLESRKHVPELIFHVFAPIISALRKVHTLGFVHRDVKPDNILINSRGIPKLSDYGFAAPNNSKDAKQIVGTPFFIDPAVILDQHSFDERSDIFSLGISIACLVRPTNPLELFGKDINASKVVDCFRKDECTFLRRTEEHIRSKFVLDEVDRINESWEKDYRFISRMVLFQQEERPTLGKLLQLRVMHDSIKDWRKFLANEEPSVSFTSARNKLISLMRGENGIDHIL